MNKTKDKEAAALRPAVISLGWPRIGRRRELKVLLERHWKGELSADALRTEAASLEQLHWLRQRELGLDQVAVNDLPLYDHVLATACALGVVPRRFARAGLHAAGQPVSLACEFAMARGSAEHDLPAMEMTKYLNTNYHYIVPELDPAQSLHLDASASIASLRRAVALGLDARPVILGPVSFLLLSRCVTPAVAPLDLLERVLPLYRVWLDALHAAGAKWVQLDEPLLCTDLNETARAALRRSCQALYSPTGPRLLLSASHAALDDNLELALELHVDGLHVDAVHGSWEQVQTLARRCQGVLSVGCVDGRNIWRADLRSLHGRLQPLHQALGARLWLAPSCSLMHVPVTLADETALEPVLKSWLSFAEEKLGELGCLRRALVEGPEAVSAELAASDAIRHSRSCDPRTKIGAVRKRQADLRIEDEQRHSPFAQRWLLQQARLNLPLLPSTTIGSFPQTPAIRQARAAWRQGKLETANYERFLQDEIAACIRIQEELGLDVLVHGEAERNDMVEHFGERLSGFAFTKYAWVQSYGSRCVKPPLIFGDVERPAPMTVYWSSYAQSLSQRPVKGMLTGPVTMLKWAFVRDDQPWSCTAEQMALALRDEITDLEAAGIAIIQVDEPALREGLPLRRLDQAAYLDWSVRAFRLATAGVADHTQIHSHMCYCDFTEVRQSIIDMDCDVLSLEAARSGMSLLEDFSSRIYPADLGPGCWDIHSPRIPSATEMKELLRLALLHIDARRLWVNPDCGLKTRQWLQVKAALAHMVQAATELRAELQHEEEDLHSGCSASCTHR